MKFNRKTSLRLGISIPLFLIVALSIISGCNNSDLPPIISSVQSTPPDFSKPIILESFSPDSGGVGTQLVLKGQNFGTDSNYLYVTVNDKKAKIVGVKNDYIYAVVPARADTGYVRLYVGQGDNVEEYALDKPFRYKFKRNVTTLAGKDQENGRIDGDYGEARLQRPWFLLADKDDAMYFVDEGRGTDKNGALRRAREDLIETLVQCSAGPFQSPTCLAFSKNEDTLYITNKSSHEVTTDVNILYCTRAGGFVDTKPFVYMKGAQTQGIAVNPKTGEVFFDSQTDGYIYRYTGTGKTATQEDTPYEQLFRISGSSNVEMRMLFSQDGSTLYVVIRNRHCIYKINYDTETRTFGVPEMFAGLWGESGYANGVGTGARFNWPGQPALDEDGNLYVPDKSNHCIRKITPQGEVSLYAGKGTEAGYKDGTPDRARFRDPEAVVFLSDGAMYVADRNNHCIRRVVVE